MKKNTKKRAPMMTALRAILVVLTCIYPLFMVVMTSVGLLFNAESYGAKVRNIAIVFLVSAIFSGAGLVLVLIKRNIASIASNVIGLILCMISLAQLRSHADAKGWSNRFTLEPISNMYARRIFPVIVPFILALVVAAAQQLTGEKREHQ